MLKGCLISILRVLSKTKYFLCFFENYFKNYNAKVLKVLKVLNSAIVLKLAQCRLKHQSRLHSWLDFDGRKQN